MPITRKPDETTKRHRRRIKTLRLIVSERGKYRAMKKVAQRKNQESRQKDRKDLIYATLQFLVFIVMERCNKTGYFYPIWRELFYAFWNWKNLSTFCNLILLIMDARSSSLFDYKI